MKNNFAATVMISGVLTIASPALAQVSASPALVSASSVLQYVPFILAFAALFWGIALVLKHKDIRGSYLILVLSAAIVCFLPLFFSNLSSQTLITSLICDFLVAIWLRGFEIKILAR
jgi:hypothetical protein